MNETVTSAQNGTVKRLRQLMTSSKARRDENMFIAEGAHLVKSFLAAKMTPALYIYAESAMQNNEIAQLVEELKATGAPYNILSDSLFESIATIHAATGILILFSPEPPEEGATVLTKSTVLLENVQDPGNLGTMLRTTAAAGIRYVELSAGCASPWSPKALRAGMGAQFSLAIREEVDLVQSAAQSRIPVLATTLSGESVSLYDADLRGDIAWVFGSEGQGVSEALAQSATNRVHIPQATTSVESLNVAAAAAVCLYEHYRQNNS